MRPKSWLNASTMIGSEAEYAHYGHNALAARRIGRSSCDRQSCADEYFGNVAPASVFDRAWLAMALAQLGRFSEAARFEAEAIRLAEPMQHAFTVGRAYLAVGTLHPLEGSWYWLCQAGSELDI